MNLPEGYKPTNAAERIALYFAPDGDESILHPGDYEIVARWTYIDDMLRKFMTGTEAIAYLLKRYPHISESTARNDLTAAKKLFGFVKKEDREHNISILSDFLKVATRRALEKHDYRAIASLVKNFIIIHQLDKDPADTTLKNLQQHINIFKFDPTELEIDNEGALDQLIKDFFHQGKDDIEDVDFTELG